ncbi:MAG: sulfocyanin-like copper-binding protein [Dehalococcoidia bacterium]
MFKTCSLLRPLLVVAVSSAAAIGLPSCGGSSGGGPQVNGTWDSFSAKVTPGTASAGKITFNVTNAAAIEHEFVVLKTDTPQEQLAVGADGKVPELGKVGEIAEFKGPNVSKKLTLDLKPGKYVLVCNTPGHYQKGIHVGFTVQ